MPNNLMTRWFKPRALRMHRNSRTNHTAIVVLDHRAGTRYYDPVRLYIIEK